MANIPIDNSALDDCLEGLNQLSIDVAPVQDVADPPIPQQLFSNPEILKLSPDELKMRGVSDEVIQRVMMYRQLLPNGTANAHQPSIHPPQPSGPQIGTVPPFSGLNIPGEQLIKAQEKVRAAIGRYNNKLDYSSVNMSYEQGILLEESIQQTQSLLKQVAQNLVSFVVLAPDDERELDQIARTVVTLADQARILQRPAQEKRFIFGLGDLNQFRNQLTTFLMHVKALQSQALPVPLQNQQSSGVLSQGSPPERSGPQPPSTNTLFPGMTIPREQLVTAQEKVRAAIGRYHNKLDYSSVNISPEQRILLEQSIQQTQSLLKQAAQNLVSFVVLAPDDERELDQVAQTVVTLSDQAQILSKPPPEKRFIFGLGDLNQYRNNLTTFLMRVKSLQSRALALQNQPNSGALPSNPPPAPAPQQEPAAPLQPPVQMPM